VIAGHYPPEYSGVQRIRGGWIGAFIWLDGHKASFIGVGSYGTLIFDMESPQVVVGLSSALNKDESFGEIVVEKSPDAVSVLEFWPQVVGLWPSPARHLLTQDRAGVRAVISSGLLG
jgi:hypothetical protein